MNAQTPFKVERWTAASRGAIAVAAVLGLVAIVAPLWLGPGAMDRLTILFVYVILAAMWNALAGYAGLVSVGQQLWLGLGAYFTIKLADWGLNPFVAMIVAGAITAIVAVPLSFPMLRLRGGEFAIGMWVVAELAHLMVNIDPLVRGETGTSLIALNAFDPVLRRNVIYWLALIAMAGLLGGLFVLLRSRVGAAIQAIRDNEEAAASVGVRVTQTKRLIFVLAAFGVGLAGALWLATALTFQPKSYFSVQWTAYMIFMVLVGGIGTFEGAIIGAVIFFLIETWFGAAGVWYLVGLGGAALIFALLLPRGIWGEIERRTGLRLLPVGYRLEIKLPGLGTGSERSIPEISDAITASLHTVPTSREKIMDIGLLIDGEERKAEHGATYDRNDPYTGKLATRAAAASVADAKAAVDVAAAAFKTWSKTGPGERRALLMKAGDIMESKVAEFSRLMIEETGGTAPWAGFNVMLAAGMLREAGAMTTQISGEVIPSNNPAITLAMGIRQPAGVVLGIAPWNAPVILGTRAIAMPLACGNTVVLKASESCPGIHRLIGQCLVEAGIPKGVINVITNDPKDAAAVVEALIAHPAVRRVNFTGSTGVGKRIGELAGKYLKPALLELGGKAPLVVLDDADVDAAVNAAIFGAFMHQGQICMSTEKIIVDEKIADEFVDKMSKRAAQLPAGDPRGHVVLGSLISTHSAEKMDELIADATKKGARLKAGGKRTGTVVEATVLDYVKPGMRIYSEESFGPVKPVIRVKGEEEAIRVANDTEYGLSSAVFSRDVQRALRVASQIEAGICHINGPTLNDEAQMPFGGVKGSGFGRFGGKAAINEFTDLRWITIEDPKQGYPF